MEEFGKKVEAFGQNIWDKTKRAVNAVSMNNDISTKERQRADLYAEIGEAYCKAHTSDAQTEFPELCGQAFRLTDEINELRAAVLRIKGYRQCPQCDAMVESSAAYCPRCGAAMPEEPEPEPEAEAAAQTEQASCADCGAPLKETDAFCASCGAKRA